MLLAVGFEGGTPTAVGLALFAPLSLVYALLCRSSWFLCRVFPVDAARAWRAIGVHALAAVLASALWGAAGSAWAGALDAATGSDATVQLINGRGPVIFIVGAFLYWLAAAFHYLLIAFEASREAERRALEHDLLAKDAELKALRAQIDPHFIFNCLHSVSALTSSNPAAARRMCVLLADFLRDTLRFGATERIPLADELALAERYLAIEQIRLGPRLQVLREADAGAGECLVPPLLLQPLVENAVKHGVAQLIEGGTIRVAARRQGALVTITLENPCDPDRRRGRGVGLGLELLRRRLAAQFGVYDAVKVGEENGQYRVEVRMPVVTA